MRKPKILLTGATGKTGAPSTLLLLGKGYPVRAFVHRQDARSESLRRAGAEIFVGSLEDPTAMREAMRGVERAYYCPPLEPGALRRATIFADAAQEAKLEAVVVLSQWLVDRTHLSIHARLSGAEPATPPREQPTAACAGTLYLAVELAGRRAALDLARRP